MTEKPPADKRAAKPPAIKPPVRSPDREQDLAAALRENLKRRKAQAQARSKTERDEPQKD